MHFEVNKTCVLPLHLLMTADWPILLSNSAHLQKFWLEHFSYSDSWVQVLQSVEDMTVW